MISELKELFEVWIVAVTAAIRAVASRIVPQQRIQLVEGDANCFAARVVSGRKGPILPQAEFRLAYGRPEPGLPEAWRAALRGSRIDIMMRPDNVLLRTVDFPKQAADFVDGMVRAQIDRLTPWVASEALFGIAAPVPIENERIAVAMRAAEASPAELRQAPEASTPAQSDGIAAIEQIQPEPTITPDADDTQNLILRG